jgi:hypothetical protein
MIVRTKLVRLNPYLLLAGISAVSMLGYLTASHYYYRLGFPLDDAWIHQTYARNLATYGEWAFRPGIVSAGSTSPLWSGVLGLGYLIGLGPYIWTYFLGWIFLFSISFVGFRAFRYLCPARENWALWIGIFLSLEWHLVWAASSGMETLPFAFLIFLELTLLARKYTNWLVLGLLAGLSVWLRPDGVTLAAPALICAFLVPTNWRDRFSAISRLGLGILILVLPYFIFNQSLSGYWLPNTFFAKQAEYAIQRQIPFTCRWFAQAGLPLVGAGVLLLPGFFLFILRVIRIRMWGALMGVLWVLGYLSMYAWRLPVTYQHGRYVMPVIPVYFLCSLVGMFYWLQPSSSALWQRVLGKVYLLSLGGVLVAFWFVGARAFSRDVAVIESEMVITAQWIEANTKASSLIAAHDIGALGYFSKRRILDLAGLTSPEVIPFIRDEKRLENYLDHNGVNYLVTFPSWYPHLVQRGELIYSTKGSFSPALGGENMSVYRWSTP